MCKEEHKLEECDPFKKLNRNERFEKLKGEDICYNCLRRGHRSFACRSRRCNICNRKHNILLHREERANETKSTTEGTNVALENIPSCLSTNQENGNVTCMSSYRRRKEVLLSTTQLLVKGNIGRLVSCRALLDNGSQSNFISEELVELLKLNKIKTHIPVFGLNKASVNVNKVVKAEVKSIVSEFTANLEFLVVPKVTSELPTRFIDVRKWSIPEDIILADPEFNKPEKNDKLIGCELFMKIMTEGRLELDVNLPILQNTRFGWIVSGVAESVTAMTLVAESDEPTNYELNQQLKRFWGIESIENRSVMSIEEKLVEEHFLDTVTRNEDGKYVVNMPFKETIRKLGKSRQIALKQFLNLERRLNKNVEIKKNYDAFMQQYEDMGHMELIINEDDDKGYFVPHHCVLKPESTTTALRVVFNASQKTSSGLSLNDTMHVGPKVQEDLFLIMMRFRKNAVALTADVEKMYRQIWINDQQTSFQKILWRKDEKERIGTYKLKTLTYGTSAAPYLATRVLKQIALEETEVDSKVRRIILKVL